MTHHCKWLVLVGLLLANALHAQTPPAFDETQIGRVQDLLIDSLKPSPDGRHLAYAVKRGPQTLLALDDAINPNPFDGIGAEAITFSPDSARVAYLAAVGKQWTLVDATTPGKSYDTFAKGSVVFSSDSRHLAAVAERDGKRFVLIDGVEGPAYDDVTSFSFGPLPGAAGPHYAYAGRTDATWHVVIDGIESKQTYDEVLLSPIVYSADGNQVAYAARRDGAWRLTRNDADTQCPGAVARGSVVFSQDGSHLACVVLSAAGAQVMVDGKTMVTCDEIAGPPIVSPHLVVVARRGTKWGVLVDGKAGREFDKITSAVATSEDGNRIGYATMKGQQAFAVIDGKEVGPYDEVMEGPRFSADGQHAGFVARRERQQFWVIDNSEGPPFDAVGRLTLAAAGHFACGVQQGSDAHLVLDGSPSPALGGFIRGATIVFDPTGRCSTLAYRGDVLLRLEARPKKPTSNPLPAP